MNSIETGSDLITDVIRDGDVITCRMTEDLTVKTVPWAKVVFGKLIKDYKPQRLVIDLRDVSFMDSSGLASLVLALKMMPQGGRVALRNPQQTVRGLIGIAHLDKLFDFDEMPPSEQTAPIA